MHKYNSQFVLGGRLFVVFGELPVCDADNAFTHLRRTDDGRYLDESTGYRLGTSSDHPLQTPSECGIRVSLAKNNAEALRAQRAAFLNRFATQQPATSSDEVSSSTSSRPDNPTNGSSGSGNDG